MPKSLQDKSLNQDRMIDGVANGIKRFLDDREIVYQTETQIIVRTDDGHRLIQAGFYIPSLFTVIESLGGFQYSDSVMIESKLRHIYELNHINLIPVRLGQPDDLPDMKDYWQKTLDAYLYTQIRKFYYTRIGPFDELIPVKP